MGVDRLEKEKQRLDALARSLHWQRIRYFAHEHREDAAHDNSLIEWYECPIGPSFFLQINKTPHWCAAVYAINYRLLSGWRRFEFPSNHRILAQEAERLRPWLDRSWFATPEKRSAYRRLHQECANVTWKRVRQGEVPQLALKQCEMSFGNKSDRATPAR